MAGELTLRWIHTIQLVEVMSLSGSDLCIIRHCVTRLQCGPVGRGLEGRGARILLLAVDSPLTSRVICEVAFHHITDSMDFRLFVPLRRTHSLRLQLPVLTFESSPATDSL